MAGPDMSRIDVQDKSPDRLSIVVRSESPLCGLALSAFFALIAAGAAAALISSSGMPGGSVAELVVAAVTGLLFAPWMAWSAVGKQVIEVDGEAMTYTMHFWPFRRSKRFALADLTDIKPMHLGTVKDGLRRRESWGVSFRCRRVIHDIADGLKQAEAERVAGLINRRVIASDAMAA